tara:strand:- start:210 stop:623 length:414 start_codon:yes stop_codon:yes gene_type:complete
MSKFIYSNIPQAARAWIESQKRGSDQGGDGDGWAQARAGTPWGSCDHNRAPTTSMNTATVASLVIPATDPGVLPLDGWSVGGEWISRTQTGIMLIHRRLPPVRFVASPELEWGDGIGQVRVQHMTETATNLGTRKTR